MSEIFSFLPILDSLLNNAIVGGLLVYWVAIHREGKKEKLNIFKTLMATRALTLSSEHVNALNSIDLEFYHEKKVIAAWHLYLDHLNNNPSDQNWLNKKQELFIDLLYTMGEVVGYEFDKVLLKNALYFPVAHGVYESDTHAIRKGFLDVISGKSEVSVRITNGNLEKEKYTTPNS